MQITAWGWIHLSDEIWTGGCCEGGRGRGLGLETWDWQLQRREGGSLQPTGLKYCICSCCLPSPSPPSTSPPPGTAWEAGTDKSDILRSHNELSACDMITMLPVVTVEKEVQPAACQGCCSLLHQSNYFSQFTLSKQEVVFCHCQLIFSIFTSYLHQMFAMSSKRDVAILA